MELLLACAVGKVHWRLSVPTVIEEKVWNRTCYRRQKLLPEMGIRWYASSGSSTCILLSKLIQTQLFVCDVEYCDFCLCTFTGDESGLHIEHVYKDTCLWSDCVARAKFFLEPVFFPSYSENGIQGQTPEKLHTFLKQ